MATNDLRITKLREYLMNIISQLNDKYKQINVDFLSNEPDNYSLDKIPVVPNVDSWIIGNFVKIRVASMDILKK